MSTTYRRALWLPLAAALAAIGFAAPARAAAPLFKTFIAPEPASESPPAAAPSTGRPRFELHVPSLERLLSEAARSHTGVFWNRLTSILGELTTRTAEGAEMAEAAVWIEQMRSWPDTAIDLVTYSPDAAGRPRWAARLNWPLADLNNRLQAIWDLEAAATLIEGVRLVLSPGEGYRLMVGDELVAVLAAEGEQRCRIASGFDVVVPAALLEGGAEGETPALLGARLNLAATEVDSGATLLSSFSAVTAVTYDGRVDDSGQWIENVRVHWPPISGMGAKLLFGEVKKSFFVPGEALGAVAFDTMMAPAMLENLAGFGPQVFMDGGRMELVAQETAGPVMSHSGTEVCVSLLAGTGFFPFPDIVVQTRASGIETLTDDLRKAAGKINGEYLRRDQAAPWNEFQIADRTVFFSEVSERLRGMMMPLVLRPVIFTTRETDARDKQRDYLVTIWTSTSPEQAVRRWLNLPRDRERRLMPSDNKTSGQAWLNWGALYRQFLPYINVGFGAVAAGSMLPDAADVAAHLTDGVLTLKMKYSGLQLEHSGPIPVGVVAVPALFSLALDTGETAAGDLARERLAGRRLRLLYHHCKLFHKDQGRWPAEVAELEGYIDFAGHPELLTIETSPRKQWSDWIEEVFSAGEEAEKPEEEDDDGEDRPASSDIYVIEWGSQEWRLGFASGTFEHLEKLFVDQDGQIHRVVKSNQNAPKPEPELQ